MSATAEKVETVEETTEEQDPVRAWRIAGAKALGADDLTAELLADDRSIVSVGDVRELVKQGADLRTAIALASGRFVQLST